MTFKQRFEKWVKTKSYDTSLLYFVGGWYHTIMRLAYGWGKRDERGRVCKWTTDGSFWYPGCNKESQGRRPHLYSYKFCPYCGGKIKEEKA